MQETLKHKLFIEGDDMSISQIVDTIYAKMDEYIKDDPTCEVKCIMTDDKPVEGLFPNGIYTFLPAGVIKTPHNIQFVFYPNVIQRFGSLKGDYFMPPGHRDVIHGGVVGLIDIVTKLMFRKWQQYRFMKIFGFDISLINKEELTQDAFDYAFGQINNIQYECAKVVMEDIVKRHLNKAGDTNGNATV